MSNATLVGYHGRRNLGDDIFLRMGCRWLAQYTDAKRVFVAGQRGHVPVFLTDMGLELQAFEYPRFPIARFVWLQTFFYALRSRVLLFAAGSIFTIQPFFLAYVILRLLKLMKPRMSIIALGVSVGPLRTSFDRRWCGKLLGLFDCIVLRDQESLRLLHEINPHASAVLAYDMALAWPPAQVRSAHPGAPILGLCLNRSAHCMPQADDPRKSLADVLVETIVQARRNSPGLSVRLMVVCVDDIDGDMAVAQALQEQLEALDVPVERHLYDGIDPERFLASLGACSAIVTSRMHTGILAMMQAVPVFQIAYARKITDLFAHCGLGEGALCLPEELSRKDLGGFVHEALAGGGKGLALERQSALQACGHAVQQAMGAAASRLQVRG